MQDLLEVTGIVLKAEPVGEYDRRMVLLTGSHGKITVFAKGARRPNSRFIAASNPFCFGKFRVFVGKTSYSLSDAEIHSYFDELKQDYEKVIYGMYFLELADYYSRENLEAEELLKLLYFSLKALLHPAFPDPMVRVVYELKALAIDGVLPEAESGTWSEAMCYTVEFIRKTEVGKLYSFALKDSVLEELERWGSICRKRFIDKPLKSMELLP